MLSKEIKTKLNNIRTMRKATNTFDKTAAKLINTVQELEAKILKDKIIDKSVDDLGSIRIETDLTRCPECGQYADNGHDRCVPPNPYMCTRCQNERESEISLAND